MENLSVLNIGVETPSLIIGYKPQLTAVTIFSLSLSSLDLSGCPIISSLRLTLYNESDDIFINLKNGNPLYGGVNTTATIITDYTEYHRTICVDEGEIEHIATDYQNFIFSTYCNFHPGGNYNTITGTIRSDINNDGCDEGDAVVATGSVLISDGISTGYTYSYNGVYHFFTGTGTFVMVPHFENDWFIASPVTVTFSDNNNNTATQNFCVTANGVHDDVEVVLIPIVPARPGFDALYKVVYKNKGNQTLSGTVSFTYSDDVLDYVTAVPVETASAMGSLSWNYADLLPFESREVLLVLNVNGPMENPAVNNDDILLFAVSITPTTNDETPADNTFALNQVVIGSYDPNDITCLEGASVHPEKIGEYLHYNINFENTGSAPATFVVVKDMIDLAKFDISTLQILNASHDVQARITGNKVEFIFDAINLAANGGKGNVTFKIKTLNSLVVNSSVTQAADIYFDYNWPIVTNDAVTTFEVLNTNVLTKDATVKVYPNPVKDIVSISAGSVITSLQLYDLQGRLLQSQQNDVTTASFDLSGRAAGVYFVKAFTEKGASVQKVIKE